MKQKTLARPKHSTKEVVKALNDAVSKEKAKAKGPDLINFSFEASKKLVEKKNSDLDPIVESTLTLVLSKEKDVKIADKESLPDLIAS